MFNKTSGRLYLLIVLAVFQMCLTYAQEVQAGQKAWSAENHMTLEDFSLKVEGEGRDPIFVQFGIGYEARGFDFLKRNFNQNVKNVFVGQASWVDTTYSGDINHLIAFQQMLFDLAEVHARHFRKRLLQERKQIIKGLDIVEKINNEILTNFSKDRLLIIKETKQGTDIEKIQEWKEKIQSDLEALHVFRYENTKKIKLDE